MAKRTKKTEDETPEEVMEEQPGDALLDEVQAASEEQPHVPAEDFKPVDDGEGTVQKPTLSGQTKAEAKRFEHPGTNNMSREDIGKKEENN